MHKQAPTHTHLIRKAPLQILQALLRPSQPLSKLSRLSNRRMRLSQLGLQFPDAHKALP